MSWIPIFGRSLVLPPQKLRKRYLHHLVRLFPTQRKTVRISRLRRGPCGLCSSPPLCFEVVSPKHAITNIFVLSLESLICVSSLRSAMRISTKSRRESVNGCWIMSGASPPFVSEKAKADSIHASSLYYQHNPERLPACPVTIHALLHIPDQIRWMGPCWTTWAFPIERQCGYFQRSTYSRRNPYVSMDRHLTDLSQLRQIKILYNLTDEQLGKRPKDHSSFAKRLENCKSCLSTFT